MISTYDELSASGKIVYTQYKLGKLNEAQVNSLVTKNKISSDERDFILAV